MVNEQLKNFNKIIQKLVENQPELFNKEEIDASLQAIDNLLETVQQQAEEIAANKQLLFTYQAQTQGLQSKLTRKRPRRLSLNNDEEPSFVSISPRRGSSRSDYEEYSSPFSPFRSPHTPRSLSPTIPELNVISDLVEQRETELTANATEVIAELQTNEEKLRQQIGSLRHELSQKEDYVKKLETDRAEQDKNIARSEAATSELATYKANLLKQKEIISKIEKELDETNNDFLLAAKKNEGLQKELQETRQKKTELEQRLQHEIDERNRLNDNKEQTYSALLTKYQEIARAKEASEKERAELANLIQQQETDYELERKQREEEFQKQINNLRTFQINGSSLTETIKIKHAHSHSFSSLPISRGNSFANKDEEIFFSPEPASNLFTELNKQGYQEQSGTISNKESKRRSTSSLLNQPPPDIPTDKINIEDIFSNIDQLGAIQNNPEYCQLLEEKTVLEASTQKLNEELLKHQEEKKHAHQQISRLTENYTSLERIYKDLADEQLDKDRKIKDVNAELLIFKENQKKLIEELNEIKYQLAESERGKMRAADYQSELEDELDAKIVENQELKDEQDSDLSGLQELRSLLKQLSQPLKEIKEELKIESQIEITKK